MYNPKKCSESAQTLFPLGCGLATTIQTTVVSSSQARPCPQQRKRVWGVVWAQVIGTLKSVSSFCANGIYKCRVHTNQ